MQKLTTFIGYITAFAIVVSAVFKIEHLPGAGTALLLTGLLLGIYFPIFILSKMSEKSDGKILLSHIAAALSASIINFGITFRIWHFAGADILLLIGLGSFSLIVIPMLYFQHIKDAKSDKIWIGFGALGLQFLYWVFFVNCFIGKVRQYYWRWGSFVYF